MAKKKTEQTIDPKKGILLIAAGHPNYGKLAATLAMSLRSIGCSWPITVAVTEGSLSHVTPEYLEYISDTVTIPQEYITHNGEVCYIKAKAHINDLTPYDWTLFIDADVVMLTMIKWEDIEAKITQHNFTVKNSGYKLFSETTENNEQWCKVSDVVEAYKFAKEKRFDVHSEFIFWKKTEATNALFKEWANQYKNLKIKGYKFAGCIPDELPLFIAIAKTETYPEIENWHPTYWPHAVSGMKTIAQMNDDGYFGFSIGGRTLSPQIKERYDIISKVHAKRMGISRTFQALPKHRWLPERDKF
jgi:hypothetical protein